MYAMVLGRLPFCTPFKDEYHRQRMLQQIHKGLSATHDREMQPLSAGQLSSLLSEAPFTRYNLLSNRLSNRLYNPV